MNLTRGAREIVIIRLAGGSSNVKGLREIVSNREERRMS
jgi:hypothetical protein